MDIKTLGIVFAVLILFISRKLSMTKEHYVCSMKLIV